MCHAHGSHGSLGSCLHGLAHDGEPARVHVTVTGAPPYISVHRLNPPSGHVPHWDDLSQGRNPWPGKPGTQRIGASVRPVLALHAKSDHTCPSRRVEEEVS